MEKLVSIVLPVYNGEKYLAESIESVLNQTYKNLELIIVNDCSTDSTEDIALKYKAQDRRIIYIKNEVNSKLPKSLNNGFKIAKGEYYTWTSDDNRYHEDAIFEMVDFLEKNQDVAMVFAGYDAIDDKGDVKYRYLPQGNLIYNNIIGACFLYRSAVAKAVGEYREDLFLVEDYEYWLRINLDYKIVPFSKCLYVYRFHGGSLTALKKKEIKSALKKLHSMYLKKYEEMGMTEDKIIEYFKTTLRYYDSFIERSWQRVLFAIKHKQYGKELISKIKQKVFKRQI
ncbi:MAG: glycosyltransferase [Clostridia bacterium]|nr:glycosyltransferase [Clostridia bacterium]